MAGEEFENRLDYYAKAWLPARDVVLEAVNKRFEVDPSGQIVIFNQVRTFCSSKKTSLIPSPATVRPMEGTHLLPRSAPLAQPGNLANLVRPLPGKLGKAGRQVEDPVCAQGR